MDRPWRTSDFNEWLALSRMPVQKLLGGPERVEGARLRIKFVLRADEEMHWVKAARAS